VNGTYLDTRADLELILDATPTADGTYEGVHFRCAA